MEAVVRATLGLVITEEDVLEHLVGVLESEPSEEESGQMVRDFLMTAGEVDDDEAARLSTALFRSLRGGADGGAEAETPRPPPCSSSGPARLATTVRMGADELRDEAVAKALKKHAKLETCEASVKSLRHVRKAQVREQRLVADREALERSVEMEMRLATAREDPGQNNASALEEQDNNGEAMGDLALDVHLRGFDLANKKGSGDLLNGAAVTFAAGRRYGLLGRNGCGKTTFLEYLASRPAAPNRSHKSSSAAAVVIPARMSMLLVKQEVVGSEVSACDTVVRSDARREGMKAAARQLEDVKTPTTSSCDALAKLYEKLARRDEVRGAPVPRARKVLAGLGFSDALMDSPTSALSGGWRMRVSLACALFAAPSLLLLDEPTNHLDLEAVMWLERYLTSSFRGTVVTVSHDRAFLNTVVTDVVHFDQTTKKLKQYRGDVANFEAVWSDDRAARSRQREAQEMKRAALEKYVEDHAKAGSNGPKAAAQRKSRMKKLTRLGIEAAGEGRRYKASYDDDAEEVDEVDEEEEVVLTFPDPGPFDRPIVKARDCAFTYDETSSSSAAPKSWLLKGVDLSIDSKARIALLGRNGSGKSTLIKLLVGELYPTTGDIIVAPGAKIEYLAQHQLDQLDPFGTPLGALLELYPGDGSNAHQHILRTHLARFGLGGERLPTQKIHTLSGGQKCRVCLAAAMYRRPVLVEISRTSDDALPHLLVLDEPTNHLDMETTDALIAAIRDFQGGVLLVSHDEHLCSKVCSDLFVVHDTKVQRYDASFAQYKREVFHGRR